MEMEDAFTFVLVLSPASSLSAREFDVDIKQMTPARDGDLRVHVTLLLFKSTAQPHILLVRSFVRRPYSDLPLRSCSLVAMLIKLIAALLSLRPVPTRIAHPRAAAAC